MSDTKYCKDCKNIECPEGRVNCKYPDAIGCAFYRDTPQILFDRITTTPEVLAPKLVYSVLAEDICTSKKKQGIIIQLLLDSDMVKKPKPSTQRCRN